MDDTSHDTPRLRECDHCDGIGLVCSLCEYRQEDCVCLPLEPDGSMACTPHLSRAPCPRCQGTGRLSRKMSNG